jgi:hypothetical protein
LAGEVEFGLARSLHHPEVETISLRDEWCCGKLGLAFLPQIAVHEELRRRKLLTLEITDAESLGGSLDVVCRAAIRCPATEEGCSRNCGTQRGGTLN